MEQKKKYMDTKQCDQIKENEEEGHFIEGVEPMDSNHLHNMGQGR